MRKLTIGLVLTIAMLLAGAAQATTLYTPPQILDTGLKGTTGDFTNLVFADFDPSLGTLTSVHIQLDGYAEAGYSFMDLSGHSNSFQFTGTVTVLVSNPSDPSNPLAITIPGLTDIPRTVAAFGSYSTPGFPTVRSLTGTNSTGELTYTDPAILALFQGPGTISLPTSGSIAWSFAGHGDAQTGVISRYLGQVTLFYDYTPNETQTPEPGSWAMLAGGLGLIGLGVLRRRA